MTMQLKSPKPTNEAKVVCRENSLFIHQFGGNQPPPRNQSKGTAKAKRMAAIAKKRGMKSGKNFHKRSTSFSIDLFMIITETCNVAFIESECGAV